MKRIYFLSMYFIFIIALINEFLSLGEGFFILFSLTGLILLIISSLSMTRGFQLYVSLISLFAGHILLFQYKLGFNIWYNSLIKSIGIPVLFVAISMITFPIKHGNYLQAEESFIALKKKSPIFLFSFLSILHLALTIY
ncbi:hypothetical protein [Tepidibacillus marianensis]|uniref:hypothetical protein n=1 Tax=Tepidibacillus marianensis TaxID=3131995 RepID=UPI0030D2EC38